MVLGGEPEARLCAEVAHLAGAVDLSGRLSFAAMVGVLSSARLLVANDSGPRHLAEAVGIGAVSI